MRRVLGIGDQLIHDFGGVGRRVGDDVDDTLGEAGLFEDRCNHEMRGRTFLGGFEDYSVAVGERRGDGANAENHRRVPRSDADDHADGLANGHGGRVRQVGGDHLADHAVGLRGGLSKLAHAENAIEHSPAEGLAGFFRRDLGDLGHAAFENVGNFQEKTAAHAGSRRTPRGERGSGGLDRAARVFALAGRNLGGYLAIERILFHIRLAIGGAGPFAIDELLCITTCDSLCHGNLLFLTDEENLFDPAWDAEFFYHIPRARRSGGQAGPQSQRRFIL